ncbi:MAG: DNA translocase FtsK, partial [Desulfobacteraceae bacterium]|nr:DNA translocase FtsK [Desulfobacteraceae bacterium]
LKYTNITGCITILVFFIIIGFTLTTGISLVTLALFIQQKTNSLMTTVINDFSEFTDYLKLQLIRFQESRKQIKLDKVKLGRADLGRDNALGTQKEIDITPASPEKKALIKIPERGIKKKEESIPLDDLFEPNIVEFKPDDNEYLADSRIEDIREKSQFTLPKLSFLDEKPQVTRHIDTQFLQDKARILEEKLKDFNVAGEVVEILPGPVITTFEYRPAPGIKLSKIVGLSDDLALALSAISIRIVAPIPGRDVVGIEIPNEERELVNLREMLSSKAFVQSESLLTLGLGKDLLGKPVATQMDKMPHLLIAGATGTGKSVGLNSMIISLLYKATPDEVKLIMIDPKRIELSVYNDIP